MSNLNTQWRITVAADTARARSELAKFAKVAQTTGASMESVFSNVKGAPVARTFNNMGRELNRMNVAVQKSKVHMGQWNRYWKNSNNLIRYSKQLQSANSIAIEKTNGSMSSATVVMKRFNQVTASTTQRLAYMNTFFRAASRQAINAAKNVQWAGRQITVGFGVPFGLAMTGASMAFLKFEEQLVRFRKVFNAEVSDLSIEEAEARITSLANTMSTTLGVARDEVMETSALFAQMGYGVEEIERLTRATTELAMLGETDAQDAGKLLRAYSASGFVDTFIENGGSQGEFEDYIKNMLNMIENNTGLSIASMVESGMAQLIPLFSQMGVGAGIGESILAGMTEALGGRTSEAVTALKAIMQRVYDESAETTEQFGLIGVDIQGLQERYKSDFVGLIEELGRTLANNPDIQDNNKAVAETFGNLFGVRQANRAIAGLKAVSSAFDSTGKAVNDYGRALNSIEDPQEAAVRAQQELAAQAESVGGQLRRLKEAILIEASAIGETFLEMIMPLVRGIRSAIEWFGDLSEGAKRMAIGFGGVVVAAGGILTTFGVLAQAVLYMARTVGFFLPKFRTWTEENVKQRIATDHVNEALREQRSVVSNMIPLWESIEQAQRQAANSTMSLATSLERLTNVQTRGRVNSKQGLFLPGMGANGMWADPDTKRVMSDRQARMAGYGYGPTRHEFLKYGTQGRGRVNPSIGVMPSVVGNSDKGASPVKWRGGAAAAGGILGMGGMFVGGGLGQGMFAGGMGLEAAAMYGPKLQKYMSGVAEKMAMASAHGNKFMRGLKASSGLAAHLLSTATGLSIVAAAVAASAFLIKKNIDDAKVAANELRNEFQYASELADEFGMELANTTPMADSIIDPETLENSSDAMKSLLNDIRNTNPGEDVQRIFRNMAREWLAGGATLEEVNSQLDNLEAKVGVEISEISLDRLRETLERDITSAIENSFNMHLDTTSWYDFGQFTNMFNLSDPFGEEGREAIAGGAEALKRAILEGMSMEDGQAGKEFVDGILGTILTEVYQSGQPELVGEELTEVLANSLGIDHVVADTFDSIQEAMSYYYSSLINNQEYINSLTEEEFDNLQLMVDEYGRYESLTSDVANSLRALDGMGSGFSGAVGRAMTELYNMNWSTFATEGFNAFFEEIDDPVELENFIEEIFNAKNSLKLTEDEIERVNSVLVVLLDNLQSLRTGGARYNTKGYWEGGPSREVPDAGSGMQSEIDRIMESDPSGGAGAVAAENDAQSYVGTFRSALNSRRSEVIDAIMDAFDEVSERRMEALEEERDQRIELLKERQESELEVIEATKDAEIEAIDERIEAIDAYLERQKEIQDALQGQIDLNVALASGNRGQAAQIQNSMRFGTIQDAADAEKDRLRDTKDAIKSEYDVRKDEMDEHYDNLIESEKNAYELRIENEEKVRERQRENIEERTEDLEDMFLGSQDDWDKFYDHAVGVASDAGVRLTGELSNGFDTAMSEVRSKMNLDEMWENARFPNLQRAVKDATLKGYQEGMTVAEKGILEKAKELIALIPEASPEDRSAIEKALNVLAGPNDENRRYINEAREAMSGGSLVPTNVMHTGGKIGAGPPRDVPAILQTGEYVIQRKAVDALGTGFLEKMNSAHKFHTGGAAAMGAISGATTTKAMLQPLMERAVMQGAASMAVGDVGMDPSRYGARSWGKEAANTRAARQFIGGVFSGVRGAYASVDRGNPRSDHSYGKALDVMMTSLGQFADEEEKEKGWRIANFFQDNPKAFGTKYVIWQGLISSLSRDGLKKWRPYSGGGMYDPSNATGGHYDHVHISFLHNGGFAGDNPIGLMKGGRLKQNNVPAMLHRGETVLRAPVAASLERGIEMMAQSASSGGGGGLTLNIGEFHGTEENIDRLVKKVCDIMDRRERRVNPVRRIG